MPGVAPIPTGCIGNLLVEDGTLEILTANASAFSSCLSSLAHYAMNIKPTSACNPYMFIHALCNMARDEGLALFVEHPDAAFLLKFAIRGFSTKSRATAKLLVRLLGTGQWQHIITSSDLRDIRNHACNLLGGTDQDQGLQLLQVLAQTTDQSVLFSETVVRRLSEVESAWPFLATLIPSVQWHPNLARVISLRYKRDWLSNQIRRIVGPQGPVHVVVRREQLLDGLCDQLDQSPEVLRGGIDVQFNGNGENGLGDGHRREFFKLAIEELVNPNFGLFETNDGGRSIHVSITSANTQPDHISHFELCGKLIAFALLHQEALPTARFNIALLKLLLGCKPVVLGDMEFVDPEFYHRKVLYVLHGKYGDHGLSIQDLGLTFQDDPRPDLFPTLKSELLTGGAAQQVTEQNKHLYLQLLCNWRMREGVRLQWEALRRGVRALIPEEAHQRIQRMISPSEFRLLLCGLEPLDIDEWKAETVRHQDISDETWNQFWSIVRAMSECERCNLLEFVTGSPALPVGGFAALPGYGGPGAVNKFTVAPPRRAERARMGVPTAATCFNTLYMPAYPSEPEMHDAILEALANRRSGFHEGAVAE